MRGVVQGWAGSAQAGQARLLSRGGRRVRPGSRRVAGALVMAIAPGDLYLPLVKPGVSSSGLLTVSDIQWGPRLDGTRPRNSVLAGKWAAPAI